MKIAPLHRWPVAPLAAIALQQRLAPLVRLRPIRRDLRLIAGADAAFSTDDRWVIAAAVLWDLRTRTLVASGTATLPCRFPYVPGLLSFRELPCIVAAFRKLRTPPEAAIYDGQGLAHPRRIGIAAHLGLWLNIPTVGCAKSRLLGTYDEPPAERGGSSPLWHNGAQVGVVLRTRDHVQPVFVSPGHLCDHASAVRLTLATAIQYRLPEPTRLAHHLVTALRKSFDPTQP
jgi:deoxyribonuclease V